MANPEHLAKLKEGVEASNQWRKENLFVMPDFAGADLGGRDLREANLREANLWKADLGLAKLGRAYLIVLGTWSHP